MKIIVTGAYGPSQEFDPLREGGHEIALGRPVDQPARRPYTEEELVPIAEKVRAARAQNRIAYLYLNNHFSAQAVANATTLRRLLDDPVTARMPAELIARYPALEGTVATLPPVRLL